jgi:hypothetical protein
MEKQIRKDYFKNYYTENKDRIKEYQTAKLWCPCCKKSVTKWNYAKHNTTKKHKYNLIKLNYKQEGDEYFRKQEKELEDEEDYYMNQDRPYRSIFEPKGKTIF